MNMQDGTDTRGFPTTEEMEFYRLYRERIVNEDTLIYQRLSWLTTAQTIMFSFTAIAFFRGGRGQLDTAGTVIMCSLGILMCLVSFTGVCAALQAIEEVKLDYEKSYPGAHPHPLLPRLAGHSRTHRAGRRVPFLIPPMFIVAWLAVLVMALR
jgi:hypothetical protein